VQLFPSPVDVCVLIYGPKIHSNTNAIFTCSAAKNSSRQDPARTCVELPWCNYRVLCKSNVCADISRLQVEHVNKEYAYWRLYRGGVYTR
jgi:hypothetical protein